jgi:hypothetical protein
VNNQEAGKLDIAVRRRIIINVSFHFMSDNANHHTVRNAAGAAALIAGINNILTSKRASNMCWRDTFSYTVPADNHIVQNDLGPVVNNSSNSHFVKGESKQVLLVPNTTVNAGEVKRR